MEEEENQIHVVWTQCETRAQWNLYEATTELSGLSTHYEYQYCCIINNTPQNNMV